MINFVLDLFSGGVNWAAIKYKLIAYGVIILVISGTIATLSLIIKGQNKQIRGLYSKNVELKNANKENQVAIDSMSNDFAYQTQKINELIEKTQKIEYEKNELNKLFSRAYGRLEKIALARPETAKRMALWGKNGLNTRLKNLSDLTEDFYTNNEG